MRWELGREEALLVEQCCRGWFSLKSGLFAAIRDSPVWLYTTGELHEGTAGMRISFFGAAGEVTGSCYLLETGDARVLIDFGMHQGGASAEKRNRRRPPLDAGNLDAVVVTHAHIDHTGRLPMLPDMGFDGPIYMTPATSELCGILLKDAAYLQGLDAARFSRRRRRQGRNPVRPLYDAQDVEKVLRLLSPVVYESPTQVAKGITIRFVEAGHILGSASIEMTVKENGRTTVIAFSGDLGPCGVPLLRDPMPIERADIVLLESTYGDRDHRSTDGTIEELAAILRSAKDDGGKVLIPAFAVGRTQLLIYYLGELHRAGKMDSAVYIDSPMATSTTTLYRGHRDLFDDESWAIIESGDAPLNFPGLTFTRSADESRALNAIDGGAVVISASGMCTGGRIVHHLKHNLWKPSAHIVFVGYQARGTLGQRLVHGARSVRIMGEPIKVKAQIHTLGGFSAHAGRTGLMNWASSFRDRPPRLFLIHGEDKARKAFASGLTEEFGYEAELPGYNQVVEI